MQPGGATAPPLACRPKCGVRKILRFYNFSDCLMHWYRLKNNLKHILKRLFRERGGIIVKNKTYESEKNLEKWPKVGIQI